MSFISDYMFTILVASALVLLYFFIKKKLEYFPSRGIPYEKPTFINFLKAFSLTSFTDDPNRVYNKFKDSGHPIVGYYQVLGPSLVVIDPEMVQRILIKDFSHFHDHGFVINPDQEPLAGNLFNLKGDQWRTLRNKLLPTFTSGKLKGMVPNMDQCAQNLINMIKRDKNLQKDQNLKDLFKNFTLSVIASCVFAIDPTSIEDPNCEFRQVLTKISKPTLIQIIKTSLAFTFPKFVNFLKIKFFAKEVDDFFINLTKDALEMRKTSGQKRNDFIQLLLELKEKGSVQVDVRDLEEDEKKRLEQAAQSEENSNHKLEITTNLLAAQSFVFIVAGFDNTSFLTAITMYYLSKYKDIQKQVREEVKEAISKHGGMNYAALKDMQLLDGSINETLRVQGAATILLRECNKPITLDNGTTIEKGMKVLIPTQGLHEDAKYWNNPKEFNPLRFLNDDITPGTYLPFGDGPRICIAQRLSLLMTKIMLAHLLMNFELQPSSKTKEPLKLLVTMSADAIGGIWGSFDPLKE